MHSRWFSTTCCPRRCSCQPQTLHGQNPTCAPCCVIKTCADESRRNFQACSHLYTRLHSGSGADASAPTHARAHASMHFASEERCWDGYFTLHATRIPSIPSPNDAAFKHPAPIHASVTNAHAGRILDMSRSRSMLSIPSHRVHVNMSDKEVVHEFER